MGAWVGMSPHSHFRFGLLPVDEGSGDTELRKNIIQAFYYVAKDRGSRDAFDWIMEVRQKEGSSTLMRGDAVVEFYSL